MLFNEFLPVLFRLKRLDLVLKLCICCWPVTLLIIGQFACFLIALNVRKLLGSSIFTNCSHFKSNNSLTLDNYSIFDNV